mmetsp:Transcript_38982/g.115958  ORF Transcript_38982/g.115958 Transcript_38982/m.115958 type:complete len:206 (-) Transcript_38982:1395-2012(-)
MSSSEPIMSRTPHAAGSCSTIAWHMSRLTATDLTPGSALSSSSTALTHDAHIMPCTSNIVTPLDGSSAASSASKPASSMASRMLSADASSGSKSATSVPCSRDTETARTPGRLPTAASSAATHEAHVIPTTTKRASPPPALKPSPARPSTAPVLAPALAAAGVPPGSAAAMRSAASASLEPSLVRCGALLPLQPGGSQPLCSSTN